MTSIYQRFDIIRTSNRLASSQQRYCCKQGMTLLSSAAVRYQHQFGQDKHLWAFVCYLLLYNFIQQRLGADIATIPACSNTRSLPVILKRPHGT